MSVNFKFGAIGTTWNINISKDMKESEKNELFLTIQKRIDEFDKIYSRFRDDSLFAQIAKKSGKYILPDDALLIFSLYKEMYDLTDGLMTPLVGQTLSDAGYDKEYSLKPKENIKNTRAWKDIMEYDHPLLKIKEPALFDFGAIGKGYLIDIISRIINNHGINDYTVEAGGDIATKNTKKELLEIGLEDPEDSKKIVGIARITNRSICGSAGNRRKWGKFHHIINPKTLESPKHILGLWTVADTTILADALSTALFFVKPEKLAEKYDFEYAIVYKDRSLLLSKNFPGEIFKN